MTKHTAIKALKLLGSEMPGLGGASFCLEQEMTQGWVTTSGSDFDHLIEFLNYSFDWPSSKAGRPYWYGVYRALMTLKELNPNRQFLLECV